MTTKATKKDKSDWAEMRRLREESAELNHKVRVHLNRQAQAEEQLNQATKQISGLTTLLQKARDDLQFHLLENQRLTGYIDRVREVEAAERGDDFTFRTSPWTRDDIRDSDEGEEIDDDE